MIVVKNIEKVLNETTTKPVLSGGEMEDFIADQIRFHLSNNLGFKCNTEVKKV